MLDVFIDGKLVTSVSEAVIAWARNRDPKWTVQGWEPVVAVADSEGSAPTRGGLAKGMHWLQVVARGETDPSIEALNLPSNYPKHEVHFRGFVINYEPMQWRR